MTALRRTKANGFPIDGCITLDELAQLAQEGKIEEKSFPLNRLSTPIAAFSSPRRRLGDSETAGR